MQGLTRLQDSTGVTKRKAPYAPQRLDWESFLAGGGQKGKSMMDKPPAPQRPESMAAPVKPKMGTADRGFAPMMTGQYPSAFMSGQQLAAPKPVTTGARGTTGRAAPQKTTAHGQLEKAWAGLGPLGQGEAYLASLPPGSLNLPPGYQVIPGYRKSAYDGTLLPVANPGDIGSYEVLEPAEVAAFTDMMITATRNPGYQFDVRDYVDWANRGAGGQQARGPFDEEAWTAAFADQQATLTELQNTVQGYIDQGGGGSGPPSVSGDGMNNLIALLTALQQYPYGTGAGVGAQIPPMEGIQNNPWALVV